MEIIDSHAHIYPAKIAQKATEAIGDFYDIELIFQQMVDDFDHAFNGHGFFGDDQSAIGVRRGKFSLECRTFHRVGRRAVADALSFIHSENCRKQRVIMPQDKGMVKIFQHVPGDFLYFIAWIDHVHTCVDGVFDFDRKPSGVSVKILCFAFEVVKAVGVLDVECGDTAHFLLSFE